ncbi:MAG: hypothetical protein U1F57_05885 [bacterium]
MPEPQSYRFSLVSASQLSSGDPRDPFRFFREGEAPPLQNLSALPSFSLEAVDQDGNRQLNAGDRYFYFSPDQTRRAVSPEVGLQILNHWADPRVLQRDRLGLLVQSGPVHDFPVQGNANILDFIPPLSSLPAEGERANLDSDVPYWEVDGHLDLDILQGVRTFTEAENRRWTGLSGVGIYANPYYFGRQAFKTLGIAASFMAGEHFVNPTFIWQTYTTNFLSSVTGSYENRQRTAEHFRNFQNLQPSPDADSVERRLANIQMADERSRIAQDNLYWAFTAPVVGAACLADQNFRNFLRNPSILPRHFYSQFRTALPAILRSPFAMGAAALAGLGMYEISSRWYENYGGLRRGSTSNRIFSGATTVLAEAALFSRASREMAAITGSGDLTFANLMRLRSLPLQWGVGAEVQEGSVFARFYMNSPRVQAFFQERAFTPTIRMAALESPNPLASLLNRVGVPHLSLEARLSTSALTRAGAAEGAALVERATVTETTAAMESVLSRATLTEGATALEGREALLVGEELMAAGRVRVVGLPLTGLLVGAGILVGVGYLTGYFDRS